MSFLNTNSKPYKWKKNGKYIGIWIDFFKLLEKRAGLKFSLKPLPLRRVLRYVKYGVHDGCFGYYKNPKREKFAIFINIPLNVLRLKVYVLKKNKFKFNKIKDLFGKTVGTLNRQFISNDFKKAIEGNKIKAIYSDKYKQMLTQLQLSRVDCIVAASSILDTYLKKIGLQDKVISLKKIISINKVWILISKASKKAKKLNAIDKINKAMEVMKKRNEFKKIGKKYGFNWNIHED